MSSSGSFGSFFALLFSFPTSTFIWRTSWYSTFFDVPISIIASSWSTSTRPRFESLFFLFSSSLPEFLRASFRCFLLEILFPGVLLLVSSVFYDGDSPSCLAVMCHCQKPCVSMWPVSRLGSFEVSPDYGVIASVQEGWIFQSASRPRSIWWQQLWRWWPRTNHAAFNVLSVSDVTKMQFEHTYFF